MKVYTVTWMNDKGISYREPLTEEEIKYAIKNDNRWTFVKKEEVK